MKNTLSLEEILKVARAVPLWNKNNKDTYGFEYSGVFTPAGSGKEVILKVSHYRTSKYNYFFERDFYNDIYSGSLSCGETEISKLSYKAAKRVFAIAEKAHYLKENEAVFAERKRREDEKLAVIEEIKQAITGDSRLCKLAEKKQPWYRRFFG